MSSFNKFEQYTDTVLNEATGDMLNTVQAAMKRMSPGSTLFDGPGFVTNKYDPEKNYYPAIRGRSGGLFNKKMKDAEQALYTNIKQLKENGKDLYNPAVPIPSNLQPYITESFSYNYVENTINEFNDSIRNIKETLHSVQEIPSNKQKRVLQAISNFEKYRDNIKTTTTDEGETVTHTGSPFGRNEMRYRELEDALKDYLRELNNVVNVSAASTSIHLSFLHKSYVINAINEFTKELTRWDELLKRGLSSAKATVDSEPPVAGFLNKEGKIYRDLWEDFLDNILNATVGASQRGWSQGPNLYNILTGGQESKYTGRAGLRYKKIQTIEPKFLKQMHEKIMIPLFIQPRTLIYATDEQWKNIMEGGRLYKAATWLGKQAFTAGQNSPKVSL